MERKLRKRTVKVTGEAAPKKTKRSNKEKQPQPPKQPEIKLEEPEPTIEAHETPEQLADYKRRIDTALALEETINWYRPKDTSASSNLDMVLDCNHLSPAELEEYFERYRYLLDGIQRGKIENDRHDKYVRYRNDSDLTWSASTLAFESAQIRALALMCDEHFRSSKSDYFFKVLIPELCLRIFVDEHGMDEAEAIKYLMNKTD